MSRGKGTQTPNETAETLESPGTGSADTVEGRGGILILLPTAGYPAKDRLQQSSGLNLHQPSIAAYLWSLYPGHPLSCNRSHKADVQAYPQLSLRSHVDKAPSCSLDHPREDAGPTRARDHLLPSLCVGFHVPLLLLLHRRLHCTYTNFSESERSQTRSE